MYVALFKMQALPIRIGIAKIHKGVMRERGGERGGGAFQPATIDNRSMQYTLGT
jgi:hypothetical protein